MDILLVGLVFFVGMLSAFAVGLTLSRPGRRH